MRTVPKLNALAARDKAVARRILAEVEEIAAWIVEDRGCGLAYARRLAWGQHGYRVHSEPYERHADFVGVIRQTFPRTERLPNFITDRNAWP